MDHEAVELDEAPWIDEPLDALARGHLVGGVLALHALGAAAFDRGAVQLFEACVRVESLHRGEG
jgi:hypothetical protein